MSPTLYIIIVYRVNLNKLSRNFVGALRTTTTNFGVSFIDLYLLFPRNFKMIFLPHTNTVILLEPYCGTITEPGLPVAPLAPVNTNVPVPHTLAGPSMTATKENLFPPSLSGFQAQNFSVNPTMMRSQEQTMMNTFNNCQVSFIIGRSKRASEISKRQPSSCKRRAFIIEDDSD